MVALLIKVSSVLKPFHKLTYVFAFVIIANVLYQFLFIVEPSEFHDKKMMFSLLALAWLALINLMLQVFTRIPDSKKTHTNFFVNVKNKLHQGVYYLLSLVFFTLSMTLIILSLKMLRL